MACISCNKSFSSNYMILKPEEAGYLDICKILFSSDIGEMKFVDCPEGIRKEPLGRRWIIFVSAMAQKLLAAVSKPLAATGSGLEHWLNLLSSNGGFFRLVLNSLKGKVVRPEEASASYISFFGNIDKRINLIDYSKDNMSSHDDGDHNKRSYYALLSVMAAKASYENKKYIESLVEDHWKMDFLGSYDFWNDYQEKATTQAFLLDDKNDVIVVAFRGTETFDADAWSTDVDLSWFQIPGIGRIHGGFMKALGLQKTIGWPKELPENKPESAYYAIRKLLKERLENNENAKFIITGHSLGGALAVLFPAILELHEESWLLERLEGIYTFGQPRVGDQDFGEFMKRTIEKYNIEYYRFVYSYDVVPRLPYDNSTFMFKHFGTCIYYNSFYEGKVVAQEPNKNYYSLLWLIPKIVNACWELIRSFTISYTKGPEYKECGLLRLLRFFGLFTAGIPAHCFQDYVNAIKLGSSEVFLASVSNSNEDQQKLLKSQ